jgi:hypothetical protein
VTGDGATDIGASAAVTVSAADGEYAEIQPALDALSYSGRLASVLVAPGTYRDSRGYMSIRGPIALVGASATKVIIDGSGSSSSSLFVDDGAAGGALSGVTVANCGWSGLSVLLHSLDGHAPASFLVMNNIIRDNAHCGVFVRWDSSPRIVSNTIVDNGNDGIWFDHDCTALSSGFVENNIIMGNGQSGVADAPDNQTTPWADYNDVFANSMLDYYSFTPGPHRVSADPLFRDSGGHDFHLVFASPCIDAGNPASDFSREPLPNGGRANIGAYGNTAEAQVSARFSDVAATHWAYSQIQACATAGVVAGFPDGTYEPGLPVTRDQMAVYVARALVIPSGDAAIPDPVPPATFSDVPSNHWAYKHIEYAVSQNVVKGYDDGTYKPDLGVDRGQMAVFIARAMLAPGGDAGIPDPVPPATFPDVPSDFWAYKQVEYCVGQGVVKGYDDGTYRPGDLVTRDQMAVYIARAFKLPL